MSQTGFDRQARPKTPFVLREDAEVGVGLKLRRLAEGLIDSITDPGGENPPPPPKFSPEPAPY